MAEMGKNDTRQVSKYQEKIWRSFYIKFMLIMNLITQYLFFQLSLVFLDGIPITLSKTLEQKKKISLNTNLLIALFIRFWLTFLY